MVSRSIVCHLRNIAAWFCGAAQIIRAACEIGKACRESTLDRGEKKPPLMQRGLNYRSDDYQNDAALLALGQRANVAKIPMAVVRIPQALRKS